MKIFNRDKSSLADKAFEIFTEHVNSKEGTVTVALCGGRSVTDLYQKIRQGFDKIKDPSRLHFFLVDERIEKDERNASLVENLFFNHLAETGKIPYSNLHKLPNQDNRQKQLLPESYTEELKLFSPNQSFDIVVLGSGEDGHIAALFPFHKELESKEKGYAYFEDSPKPPKERITLLPESILNSSSVMLFFIGDGKKEAYKTFSSKERPDHDDIKKCPAMMIKDTIKNYIFTDIDN